VPSAIDSKLTITTADEFPAHPCVAEQKCIELFTQYCERQTSREPIRTTGDDAGAQLSASPTPLGPK
jgi:hypothetical protein